MSTPNTDNDVEIVFTTEIEETGIALATAPTKEEIYHSITERRLVEDIMRTSDDEVEKDMERVVARQFMDKTNGRPVFNAFHKNVVIRDDNGEIKMIDNFDEMKRQKAWNNKEDIEAMGITDPIPLMIEQATSSYEDDIDFS